MGDRPEPKFTAAVRKLYPTLGQLTDAADAVRALLEQPGWPVLAEILQAEIDVVDRGLDSEMPRSQAEYAMAHGRRGGLLSPTHAVHALLSHAESRLSQERAKHEGDAEPSLVRS